VPPRACAELHCRPLQSAPLALALLCRPAAWHTGLVPRLEDEGLITDLRRREDAGPFIATLASGEVHLRLSLLVRVRTGGPGGGRGETCCCAAQGVVTAVAVVRPRCLSAPARCSAPAHAPRRSGGTSTPRPAEPGPGGAPGRREPGGGAGAADHHAAAPEPPAGQQVGGAGGGAAALPAHAYLARSGPLVVVRHTARPSLAGRPLADLAAPAARGIGGGGHGGPEVGALGARRAHGVRARRLGRQAPRRESRALRVQPVGGGGGGAGCFGSAREPRRAWQTGRRGPAWAWPTAARPATLSNQQAAPQLCAPAPAALRHRTSMLDPGGRSSFRGFGTGAGGRPSASPRRRISDAAGGGGVRRRQLSAWRVAA
jgi:hypothetical protein